MCCCYQIIKRFKKYKLSYTVHVILEGLTIKSVKKAAKKYNKKIKNVIAITVLTSISNSNIKKIGHTKSIKDLLEKQTLLAKSCGCHGIVCAGSEIKFIKKILKKEIIVLVLDLKVKVLEIKKGLVVLKKLFKNGATSIVMAVQLQKII